MEINFDNCLFIGTVEELHEVCLENVTLDSNDFKTVTMPRKANYNIKLLKENKMYYYYTGGNEFAVAKIEKLEKRILTTFEVFVYKNSEPIISFDIQAKNLTNVNIMINDQIVAELVKI